MTKPDILIVEDDPATYVALPALLKTYGFSSLLVSSVKDAIEALKTEPKFVLLDLILKDEHGLELIKYIEDNKLHVKCLVTTGYMDEEINKLGYPILIKPIEFEKLLEFLEV